MPHLEEVQRFIDTPIGASFERVTSIWDVYDAFRNYPNPVGRGYSVPQLPGNVTPLEVVPPVGVQPAATAAGDGDSATPGPEAVSIPQVIDPELEPARTVFEDAPGGIYETSRSPTDWDAVYAEYVILNAPEGDVPFHGNIDWGEVAGTIVGGLFDPFGAGAATTSYFNPPGVVPSAMAPIGGAPVATGITGGVQMAANGACPPTGPKYGKICLATGVITPLRRRRRRRLLTSSDIKDLSALKSIVGGAALQGAVVQAVRR